MSMIGDRSPNTRRGLRDEVLGLIRSGSAESRADLARQTGLSPSTVSTKVEELIALGIVQELGSGSSTGGRRPRRLEIKPDAGLIGCADLGARHGSFGIMDFAGTLVAERHLPMDISDGPETVLRWVVDEINSMVSEAGFGPESLHGISIGLPGPVGSTSHKLMSPSRMPGWNGVDVPAITNNFTSVPVLVGNDANLMGLGEYVIRGSDVSDQVFVKVGSGIGSGIIASGHLHLGSNGAAGDISHVVVPDAPPVPCSCGRLGCLDALASGTALVQKIRDAGKVVADIEAVIALGRDSDPLATRLLRDAGVMTGGVLATIVNFFNPDRLILGGALSQSDVFMAGIRATIYSQCLPMATERLEISTSVASITAGLHGAGKIMLDYLFSDESAALSGKNLETKLNH
jgi:predicted NBD/HSP70 family sugar kinase